jgi:hypothetical protein
MKAADEALKAAGVGIPGLAPASAAADKAAPRPQGR